MTREAESKQDLRKLLPLEMEDVAMSQEQLEARRGEGMNFRLESAERVQTSITTEYVTP